MRILVTAGPTREYIDDVRFISNPSSGKMGYAVAAEAARRGHEVNLLSGPVCLPAPEGVSVSFFESVDELYELARAALPGADCLVMSAAVGDYAPERRIAGKRAKTAGFSLELAATRDVLASLAALKGSRAFVGFAVEVEGGVASAMRKIAEKSMDLLVLNDPASFGADSADFTFVYPDGRTKALGCIPKSDLAHLVVDEAEALFRGRVPPGGAPIN